MNTAREHLERYDTPCVGLCNSVYVDNCQGCDRTLHEDSHWSVFNDDEKLAVWERLLKKNWQHGKGVT